MSASKAFITAFGYLSINRKWLESTMNKVVRVEGSEYNVDQLKRCISFNEHVDVCRWRPEAYRLCKG